MAAVSSIDLFNALKDKVGEKEAKMLTEFMEYNAVDVFDKAKGQLATKDDIYRSERAMKEDILRLEKSTRDDILKLDTKIAETKADFLKWMIVLFAPFYIGMIVFLIKQFLH